jgi:hypothetical protein
MSGELANMGKIMNSGHIGSVGRTVENITREICWVVTPCNASFCIRLQVFLLWLFSHREDEVNIFLRNIAFL